MEDKLKFDESRLNDLVKTSTTLCDLPGYNVLSDLPVDGKADRGDIYVYGRSANIFEDVKSMYSLPISSACLMSMDNDVAYSTFALRELEVSRTVYVNTAGEI